MYGIFDAFIGGPEQLAALVTCVVVWLGLIGLGSGLGGRRRLAEADPIVGWAVAVAAATLAGVIADVPLTTVAIGLAVAATALGFWAFRRDGRLIGLGLVRMAVLGTPLILVASAMAASQWDEFSHWLSSVRFLLETDGFPNAADSQTGASFPAYPYGWPLLSFFAGSAAGMMLESAGPIFNVFLLLTFGLVVARLVAEGLGRDGVELPTWGLAALGGLAATAMNPTFVRKVAMTNYADTATAVALAFAVVLGWKALESRIDGRDREAGSLAVQAGFALVVVVALKQATLVLFVLAVAAVAVTALRHRGVAIVGLARDVAAMAIPALLVYGLWRYHVVTELAGQELGVRSIDRWYIAMIPTIIAKMAEVLVQKSGYTGLMLIAVGFAVRAIARGPRTPLDRLALIVAILFLGYNAFLLFAYVTTFSFSEARRVASLWRYNMHLGLVAVAFAAYGGALGWRRWLAGRIPGRPLAAVGVAVILVLPLPFAERLRFDREPPVPHFRHVAQAVAGLVPAEAGVFVIDPHGSGESGAITRYELGRHRPPVGYLSAFHPSEERAVRRRLAEEGITHVIVHSVTSPVARVLAVDLDPGRSYLMRRDESGAWRELESWPKPN